MSKTINSKYNLAMDEQTKHKIKYFIFTGMHLIFFLIYTLSVLYLTYSMKIKLDRFAKIINAFFVFGFLSNFPVCSF